MIGALGTIFVHRHRIRLRIRIPRIPQSLEIEASEGEPLMRYSGLILGAILVSQIKYALKIVRNVW